MVSVVFMGTPAFAVPSLEILHKAGYPIRAVVTAPDRPAGRGLQLNISPVKQYALNSGLRVLQPEKLKSPEFIEILKEIKADIYVVVAFRMLPHDVWSIPPLGTFNLHASLLPQYRGAAPINHALINGEKITGCTTFLINHEIDSGRILMQSSCEIYTNDDAGQLHDRLMIIGSKMVLQTVEGLASGSLQAQEQLSDSGSLILRNAPKLTKDTGKIDWSKSGREITNLIRGLSPYPGAFTFVQSNIGQAMLLKIFKAMFYQASDTIPGKIYIHEKKKLFIECADGKIEIMDIQLQGKKRMDTSSFLRGYPFESLCIV